MIERAVLGRLAFQHEGGTIILPVTHVLDGRTVLFRSTRGSKFDASVMARPAVFEVDEWDAASRTGASVIVNGTLDVVDDTEALDQRGHTPWAPLTGVPLWLRLRARRKRRCLNLPRVPGLKKRPSPVDVFGAWSRRFKSCQE